MRGQDQIVRFSRALLGCLQSLTGLRGLARVFPGLAAPLFVALGAMPAYPQTIETLKFTAPDGGINNRFGEAVAIWGGTAGYPLHRVLIGAPGAGAAYMWHEQEDGSWLYAGKLVPTDATPPALFGSSVAMAGNRAVIGAIGSWPDEEGAAYIFRRKANDTWVQSAKLMASDGAKGDEFGHSVAITGVSIVGDRVLVGAPYKSDYGEGSGAAYIFNREDLGVWTEEAKFTGYGWGFHLGQSAALWVDKAVVSGPSSGAGGGYAWVYERQSTGSWSKVETWSGCNGVAAAIYKDLIALGSGGGLSGAVKVYDISGSGWSLTTIYNPEPTGSGFGSSLSLLGGRMLVSARCQDDLERVDVFDQLAPQIWDRTAYLVASDLGPQAYALFGNSVAVSTDGVPLVGAPRDDDLGLNSGSAYLFAAPPPPCTAFLSPDSWSTTVTAGDWPLPGFFAVDPAGQAGEPAQWMFAADPGWPAGLSFSIANELTASAELDLAADFSVSPGTYTGTLYWTGTCNGNPNVTREAHVSATVVMPPCTAGVSPSSWAPAVTPGDPALVGFFGIDPVGQATGSGAWSFIAEPGWPAGLSAQLANELPASVELAFTSSYTVPTGDYSGTLRWIGTCNGNPGSMLDAQVTATVLPPPPPPANPPIVSSVLPSSGPYTGGTPVVILGDNFYPGSQVWFGDLPATSVTYVSPTELHAVTPLQVSKVCSPIWDVALIVDNLAPGAVGSLFPGFTYLPVNTLLVGPQQAFTSIQDAIDAALPGDAVLVDSTDAVGFPVFYNESLNLEGKAILLTSSDPGKPALLMPGSPSQRVVTIDSGEDFNTVIGCLQILSGPGAFLVRSGSSPTLVQNEMHDHQAPDAGGAILIKGGSNPHVIQNLIHTNQSTLSGGAIAVLGSGSAPLIEQNTIFGNHTDVGGGGIHVGPDAAPRIRNNEISGNSADLHGGGIRIESNGGGSLEGNVLTFNTAGVHGGGLYLGTDSAVELLDGPWAPSGAGGGEIRANRAGGDGGGLWCGRNPALDRRIAGNDICENEAEGRGGGIYFQGGSTIDIFENALHGNNPDRLGLGRYHEHGGAIACDASAELGTTLFIRNNSIAGNRADGPCALGGAIYIRGSIASPVLAAIEGNVLSGNTSQVGAAVAIDTKVFATLRRNVLAFNEVAYLCTSTPPCPQDLGCPWQSAGPADMFAPGVFERDCQLVLENNTFYQNGGGLAGASGGALHALAGMFGGSSVVNNIFSRDSGHEIFLDGASPAFVAGTNCYDVAAPGTEIWPPWILSPDPTDVLAEPEFVSHLQEPYNFALQSGSPCRDKGDPFMPVPAGGEPFIDIGAYEYGTDTGPGGWFPGAGQANGPQASLVLNLMGAGDHPGPFAASVPPWGSVLDFTWSGPPNQPVILLWGDLSPGLVSLGDIGVLDINAPQILFNGFAPGFPGSLFVLDGEGRAQQTFPLGALPPGQFLDMQGVVAQPPGSPATLRLTAAFTILVQ